MAEFFEGFCNLDAVDGTEDGACCAGLCAYGESYALKCGGKSFGVGLDLGELMGALTLIFSKNLKSGRSCNNGFSLGNQEVAAVSISYFYDVILVSKAAYVFFEYDLHIESLSFKSYFIRSVT